MSNDPALALMPSIWPRYPLTARGMRIGLLGGSFNPAHPGHRQISLEAMARLRLHQVWWLVTPGNPLKNHAGLPSLADRMRQAQVVARHPRIVVTGVEAALGTAYTAQTLAMIENRNQEAHFVWLMGADNLAQFHRWRDWRGIAGQMPIAVLDRPGWRLHALASPAALALANRRLPEAGATQLIAQPPPCWIFLSVPLSPLSSTLIRTGRSASRSRQP